MRALSHAAAARRWRPPAPSLVLAFPASSWRALAFSAGRDGGGRSFERAQLIRGGDWANPTRQRYFSVEGRCDQPKTDPPGRGIRAGRVDRRRGSGDERRSGAVIQILVGSLFAYWSPQVVKRFKPI